MYSNCVALAHVVRSQPPSGEVCYTRLSVNDAYSVGINWTADIYSIFR